MGIFDKIMFWKKEPDFGVDLTTPPAFSDPLAADPGIGGFGQAPPFNKKPDFGGTGLGNSVMDQSHPGFQEAGQGFSPTQHSMPQEQPPSNNPMDTAPWMNRTEAPVTPEIPMPQQQAPGQRTYDLNLEVISAKLDAIKAVLESMNARIHNLERMNRDQKKYTDHW